MAHLITFATGKFDITKEAPNDINTIAGESVLKWIQHQLAGAGFTSTEPSMEDWGWYMNVDGSGASYLVGATGEPNRPSPDVDWTIQVHKNRSLMDKVTRKNKLSKDDPLFALLERLVRSEPDFRGIGVAKDA
jgi:hypothetical protein